MSDFRRLLFAMEERKLPWAIFAGTEDGFADQAGLRAQFRRPNGVALDAKNNQLFVCDMMNNCIRKCDLKTGMVKTWIGKPRTRSGSD